MVPPGRGDAATKLAACRALKPQWFTFLLVSFGGGLRWGETTALARSEVDWRRGRLHVQRTWSESGARVERCKDGEGRWVTLPASAMAALRAPGEAVELEASPKEWTPEQRQLVFPNTAGRVTRYGAFPELVSRPLFRATGLTYRKPHAMRHTYATWLLKAGARHPLGQGQMGHASIGDTERTYGHLVRERHEQDVDHLDAVLWAVSSTGDGGDAAASNDIGVPRRPPASHLRLVDR